MIVVYRAVEVEEVIEQVCEKLNRELAEINLEGNNQHYWTSFVDF